MIELQKQPTPVTCVQTCLAMALGVPVEQVIARYGDRPMNQQWLCHALNECGFLWNQFMHGTWVCSGYYLLAVPSLNVRGGMHEIIVHYDMDRGCSGITVFDPSTKTTYKEDGSDLVTWSEPTFFIPGGKLP